MFYNTCNYFQVAVKFDVFLQRSREFFQPSPNAARWSQTDDVASVNLAWWKYHLQLVILKDGYRIQYQKSEKHI